MFIPFQEYFLFEDKNILYHFILQINAYFILENDKNCNTAGHCLRFPKTLCNEVSPIKPV